METFGDLCKFIFTSNKDMDLFGCGYAIRRGFR
jgi:hypothetical protein